MPIKEKKEQVVAEIKDKLSNCSCAILVDYRGLTVAEVTQMRNEFRANDVDYKVYKNTLIEIAASELGLNELASYLKGPTAIAFGIKDPVAPAKILTESIKQLKKMELKVGVVEGKVISADDVKVLAELPSREELIGKMLGSMNAPISGLVNVLGGTLRSLLYTLNAIQETKEA